MVDRGFSFANMRPMNPVPLRLRYSPMVNALRLTAVRRLAVYLSDRDFARSTLDAALQNHSAIRLAERAAIEAARRNPAYTGQVPT
jgi:hypothetical protein